MPYESLSLSEIIPAPPERIYAAWLSSDEHTAFTGDTAIVEPFVGGSHSTFDGYAVGRTVDLQPGRRIVQTWRAEDFPIGSPDSRVEVTLEETVGGTMVTILHTEIPSGQGSSYRDGWLKYYLEALKGYFATVAAAPNPKTNGVRKHPPVVKAKAAVAAKAPRATKKATSKKAATKKATTKKATTKKATKVRRASTPTGKARVTKPRGKAAPPKRKAAKNTAKKTSKTVRSKRHAPARASKRRR